MVFINQSIKTTDNFTYFDFLSYFIPGTIFLWVLQLFIKAIWAFDIINLGNIFSDSLIFIIAAFVLGHSIHYFSKNITEYIIKKIYWGGDFFSYLILVRAYNKINEQVRRQYIKIAKDNFGFNDESLNKLDLENRTGDHIQDAKEISHSIYRRFDSFVDNHNIGGKAVTANTYYNYFRGLSTSFFLCSILLLILIIMNYSVPLLAAFIFLLFFSFTFMGRAAERGEYYIKGIFDSVAAYYAKGADKNG